MGSTEVFDLVWRDYTSHLVDFSTNLLDNHDLADVNLVCDGGEVGRQTNNIKFCIKKIFNQFNCLDGESSQAYPLRMQPLVQKGHYPQILFLCLAKI